MGHCEGSFEERCAQRCICSYREEAEWVSNCLWYRKLRAPYTAALFLLLIDVKVLFFDHRPTVCDFQERFKHYADKIPDWAHQSTGMHQFAVWTALEAEGLGANLQHYNPLVDSKIAAQWSISADWELSGQLVFGTPMGEPSQKTFRPVEERFKTFGA